MGAYGIDEFHQRHSRTTTLVFLIDRFVNRTYLICSGSDAVSSEFFGAIPLFSAHWVDSSASNTGPIVALAYRGVSTEHAGHPLAAHAGTAQRIAVGVSHNGQKDLLRVALDAQGQGLGAVVVETANRLQGLEFDVVIAWHPLAGLPEPDAFHLDPGRLCVMLTRHRHACIVVGRAGDDAMLDDQPPPPTPAYLGWDPDPVLDGWEVHRRVFAALEPVRVMANHPPSAAV